MLFFLVGLLGLVSVQAQPSLSFRSISRTDVEVSWPQIESGYVLERTESLSGVALWTTLDLVPIASEGLFTVRLSATGHAQFFRLSQGELTRVGSTSPFDGETDVAVTRESILRFNAPLKKEALLHSGNFYAFSAGRRILSRAEISSDRKAATLFYLESLPGGARVDVFLDPEDLFDERGRPLDLESFDPETSILSFTTLSLTPLPTTAVIGTVYASELDSSRNPAGTNKPLAGVTITVDGMEQTLRAVTDANGNFKLTPVPPGKFFVHIDGRTVVNDALGIRYPDKAYYPFVGKAWESVAGRDDSLAGGTGKIFLPLIVAGTLQAVSQTVPTTVSFPAGVVAGNPALAGVSITVPPNSLFHDNGTRGGKVGIAPVSPDRLPGPLPPGLELPIVITVQTDGALNFDQPAPVCFPNVIDPVLGRALSAGSKQSLVSFNHKKGVWEAVGTMTVSADAKFVCTDAGSGILQPGWHGVGPIPVDPPPPPCGDGSGKASSSFRSFAGGKIIALETEEQCKQKCQMELEKQLKDLDESLLITLGKCTFNSPSNVCLNAEAIKSTFAIDRLVRKGYYDECIKKCVNPPPPPPPPPKPKKKPKSCRVKTKSFSAESQATAQPAVFETIERIRAIGREIDAVTAPFDGSIARWPAAIQKQVTDLMANANALAGGDVASYIEAYNLEIEIRAATAGTLEEPDGNAPDYPVLYMAEILRPNGTLILRGETEPFGQYQLFVPRDGKILSVRFYDPLTKSYDIIYPRLRANAPWRLPGFELFELGDAAADSDQDGLPDVVELVYGSDLRNPDSDADGIPDGAEVGQGTNLLDGRPAQTGIVGTIKTPGAALDLSVADGLVLTAEGSSGISLLTAYTGASPVLLAHVGTIGNVQRVALAAPLALAVQADTGLTAVDFSNLSEPQILYAIPVLGARAVATDGLTAFVGSSAGLIEAIDLSTGYTVQRLFLTNAVRDLGIGRGNLYVLTDDRLVSISLESRPFTVAGSTLSPFTATPNRRLFVGGGLAYAVHARGYNVFNLLDTANPLLISAVNTAQFGWRQMVSNGSGIGLAAVGNFSGDTDARNLALYDLNHPTNTGIFITQFTRPVQAEAVASYNGLAYVADREAGLQVVNYLAFDDKKSAPRINLFLASRTNGPIDRLTEGTRATLVADVIDDVQVRMVEFYLDDLLVQTDGSFPFEFTFTVPQSVPAKTTFKLKAKAIDTGGNFTWSDEILIGLLLDTTPPEVVNISPGSVAAGTKFIAVTFNEEIAPDTLTISSLRLWGAGADGVVGTGDDIEMVGGTRSVTRDARGVMMQFANTLAIGAYRIGVGREITDRRGNHLASDVVREFRVIDAIYWSAAGGGEWHKAENWSKGRVPGTNDDVLISSPIAARISFSQGNTSIRSLISDDLLVLTGGRLQVSGSMRLSDFELRSGTLASAHLALAENGQSIRLYAGVLDGVTLDADITLDNAQIVVMNGLTVNRTLRVATSETATGIGFEGAQTLGGTGQIVFGGAGNVNQFSSTGGLTIDAGLTIRGSFGFIGSPGVPLVNLGRIVAEDGAGRILEIRGVPLANLGTLEAQIGGILAVSGTWTNAGVFRLSQGTMNLGGTFSTAAIGAIQRDGGALNLQGLLNNSNSIFVLKESVGEWVLNEGTIRGGSITAEGSGLLKLKAGVLDDVTLDSDFTLENRDQIRIINDLTVNRKLILAGTENFTGITFQGAQTLGGAGEVLFAGAGTFSYVTTSSGGLTIGTGFTVRGGAGTIGEGSLPLTNEGTIVSEVPGQALRIQARDFLNMGTVEGKNGGTIVLAARWSNTGLIKIDQSTFFLDGIATTAGIGTIQRNGGAISLRGTLNNTNSVLTLNDAVGSWVLDGGSIQGGSITRSGASSLKLKSGTLDGVTLDADFTLDNGDRIFAVNGLTVNRTLTVASTGNFTGISFQNVQVLAGTGQIIFSPTPNFNYLDIGAALTIAPGLTLRGGAATIGNANVPLINEGNILAEGSGQAIRMQGRPFTNRGTVESSNGAILLMAASLINTGVLKVTQSTLSLEGSFTTDGLGTIERDGGVISLRGVLDNTNSVFAPNASQNPWVVDGGTIQGGSIGSSALKLKSGTLDGVTLDADLVLENLDQIRISNGLTVNRTLTLSSNPGFSGLVFQGTQILAGTGQIIFGGTGPLNYFSIGGGLTIGPGITIRGGAGTIGESGAPLTNEGTIIVEGAGQPLRIQGRPFTNKGTIESRSAGAIVLASEWTNAGLFKIGQSTFNLDGSFTTAGIGQIQSSGGTINLQGTLNNTNSNFELNDTGGSWVLAGGTIRGGSITTTGSGTLKLKTGILDGVTLASDFTLENGDQFQVFNGLTVDRKLTLASADNPTGISFSGEQTLRGTGEVIFGGTGSLNHLTSSGALTIGPSLTIHGRSGTVGGPNFPLINQGTILADVANGVITVQGKPFTNAGVTNSANGGKLVEVP